MSFRPRKIRPGERLEGYPIDSHNQLVERDYELRRALATIDDPRRPKIKSPVHVTIVWDATDPVEPGRPVKLGAAVFDPATDPSSPFSGLVFHANVLSALDTTRAIAITTQRIPGGGTGVGEAIIPQAYWVKVNVTNATHTFAKVITGGTIFDSDAAATYPILWKQSGTGEKWAVVLLQAASTTSVDPPLRRFELTFPKTGFQDFATVKWLDDAGNLFGANDTIYDPEFRYSGRAAEYLEGERGFRGQALQRRDLAGVAADRWEITVLETFASWAVVELYTLLPVPLWILRAYGGGPYDNRAPASIDTSINVGVPSDMLAQLSVGRRYYARLSNADTSPPTYVLVAVRQGGSGTAGALVTVYIGVNIPAAQQVGTRFRPGLATVQRYDLNDNGEYQRGANVQIENHDVEGLSITAEDGSPKAYRGLCSYNEAGRLVLHLEFCKPIP
ncbi:MAG: hypothetical protein AB7I57_18300 [Pirellulales bacterium]